jgi:RsmE family RNA methyltransferase
MNLLLLEPSELDPNGRVILRDERARHLLTVLKVKTGSAVRAGVLDGNQGTARVLEAGTDRVSLECHFDDPGPSPGADTLLLAFARPKVLSRCLEHATALGFGRIVLFRSRRVDKSHLSSHAVEAAHLEERVRRGLEQSRRTHRPSIHLVSRFRELMEEHVEALLPALNRFVADADAEEEAALSKVAAAPLSLVIGPEGGLIQHELDSFAARGFRLVRAGREPLRVETALAYLSGQLRAVRASERSSEP